MEFAEKGHFFLRPGLFVFITIWLSTCIVSDLIQYVFWYMHSHPLIPNPSLLRTPLPKRPALSTQTASVSRGTPQRLGEDNPVVFAGRCVTGGQ